jgi:deoxyribodipyrimidine photo-lyase
LQHVHDIEATPVGFIQSRNVNDLLGLRVRTINDVKTSPDGDYVLYWMISFRRPLYNFSLQRAVEWAKELGKPLVILEALRCDYPWASERHHRFVIDRMADNSAHFSKKNVLYYPYLESASGAGKGLLRELARRASVVVSDDFPAFFVRRMIAAAASQIPVRFELVDSNGLLPMRAADKVFARAFDFRRFLQKNLLPHLGMSISSRSGVVDFKWGAWSGELPRRSIEVVVGCL